MTSDGLRLLIFSRGKGQIRLRYTARELVADQLRTCLRPGTSYLNTSR